jgi:hypothetical protein
VRKLPTPLVLLSLSVALLAAGIGFGAPAAGAAPHIVTSGPMTLQLSSTMAGVTFSGNTLVCPPMSILSSSGANQAACEFSIESTGSVLPDSVVVSVSVSGITAAEASARKFALDPHTGSLVYFQTSTQALYSFTGAQLPATVDPGVVWGANAGGELDNGDLGATIVVTYTVMAQSLEGVTATPTLAPSKTPFQSLLGAVGTPGNAVTPPPTSSAQGSSSGGSSPLFALLICFLVAGAGLAAVRFQRRQQRR